MKGCGQRNKCALQFDVLAQLTNLPTIPARISLYKWLRQLKAMRDALREALDDS